MGVGQPAELVPARYWRLSAEGWMQSPVGCDVLHGGPWVEEVMVVLHGGCSSLESVSGRETEDDKGVALCRRFRLRSCPGDGIVAEMSRTI